MKRKPSFFEKIGSLIPGYKGYADRDSRRNCDKLMRKTISDKFMNFEKDMNDWSLQAFRKKEKETMRAIEHLRKELNTLKSKIEYAPYGASSFFADQQIKEEELFEIYQFDHDLLDFAEKIILCDHTHLEIIEENIQKCYDVLSERNNYISQF